MLQGLWCFFGESGDWTMCDEVWSCQNCIMMGGWKCFSGFEWVHLLKCVLVVGRDET